MPKGKVFVLLMNTLSESQELDTDVLDRRKTAPGFESQGNNGSTEESWQTKDQTNRLKEKQQEKTKR